MEPGVVYGIFSTILSVVGYLISQNFTRLEKESAVLTRELKEAGIRINELEKTNVGVQVHLDSLNDLKVQMTNVRLSLKEIAKVGSHYE